MIQFVDVNCISDSKFQITRIGSNNLKDEIFYIFQSKDKEELTFQNHWSIWCVEICPNFALLATISEYYNIVSLKCQICCMRKKLKFHNFCFRKSHLYKHPTERQLLGKNISHIKYTWLWFPLEEFHSNAKRTLKIWVTQVKHNWKTSKKPVAVRMYSHGT